MLDRELPASLPCWYWSTHVLYMLQLPCNHTTIRKLPYDLYAGENLNKNTILIVAVTHVLRSNSLRRYKPNFVKQSINFLFFFYLFLFCKRYTGVRQNCDWDMQNTRMNNEADNQANPIENNKYRYVIIYISHSWEYWNLFFPHSSSWHFLPAPITSTKSIQLTVQ